MMSVIYASIMLLWFWGTGKKKQFYARKNMKLHNFLALMDDGQSKDHQDSMTIAQQNISLRASATRLKRVRGDSAFLIVVGPNDTWRSLLANSQLPSE